MPTAPLLKMNFQRYVFHNDKRHVEVKRTNQIEDGSDDYQVLYLDIDKVISTYHTFENENLDQINRWKKNKFLSNDLNKLNETIFCRHIYHNNKRKAKAKVKHPIKNVILKRHYFLFKAHLDIMTPRKG